MEENMSPHPRGVPNLVKRAKIPKNSLQGVKELYLSRLEERNVKKYPQWDVPRFCPAFELVRTRRELNNAEEKLREKWVEQEKKRKEMDVQWAELKEQELALRESFMKYDYFIKENQEKRDRAERKIQEERERQIRYQEDIDDMTQKLNYMNDVRAKMREHVGMYKKYQNYLENVINETGSFQSIAEIFNRYEALIEARESLSEDQDKNIQMLEDKEAEIHLLMEAKTKRLVKLNNKLSLLQLKYERMKSDALKWETLVSRIKEAATEKYLELVRVKACTKNLYHQICKRKEMPASVPDENVEQQLLDIKRTIIELRNIIVTVKKEVAKKTK